jgi:hypothetical protein
VARGADADQVEGSDEEFVFHLERGSDLLARGDTEGARDALERALELRSRDPKVLGLLGQAYYRLGKYDAAIVAWQRLVDESPAEPAARVNLGLAFLRAKRQSQAVRQLEIALDLNPDHKKAMGYLGLALLESGDPQRARDWFLKAGSDQMVARCDELLGDAAGADHAPPAEGGAGELDVDVEGEAPSPEPFPEASEQADQQTSARPDATETRPEPAHETPARPEPVEGRGMRTVATQDLVSFAVAHTLAVPEDEPFALVEGFLAVRVRSDLRTRLAGVFAVRGVVDSEPEVKRFRGRPTEKPFGDGRDRLHRLRGDALLLFTPGARRFTPLRLGDSAFLREEALFALEEPIVFENGRVPSVSGAELNLVHLRGRGAVLVVGVGAPRALEVVSGAPLRLPVQALLGWVGALTPRLVSLVEGAGDATAVELAGDGTVLVDPAAAGGEGR